MKIFTLSLRFSGDGSVAPSVVPSWHAGRAALLVLGAVFAAGSISLAQTAPVQTAPAQAAASVERAHVGDAPDDPGPLATGLSSELKTKAIDAAMKKVADWQVAVAEPNFNKQWTFAALYDGLLAASKTTGDAKYHDAVLHFAERSNWTLLNERFPHADDQAFGQAYLDLYMEDPQPVRMADTKAVMDKLVVRPDDPDKLGGGGSDRPLFRPRFLFRWTESRTDKNDSA